MSHRTLNLLRVAVLLAVGVFLYVRIAAHQSTMAAWGEWHAALDNAQWWLWAVMFALAAMNWGIESAKWRLLVKGLEPMGRGRAFAATLAGTAIGLFTPNRSGEFLGRVMFLAPENRWRGGFASLLGSIAQFAVTILAGGLAFVLWFPARSGAWGGTGWGIPAALLMALVVVATLFFFFHPRSLRWVVSRVPVLRKLNTDAAVLETFPKAVSTSVLGLSAVRYIVFAAQYALILLVLANVPWNTGFLVVPLIFLATTLVPTLLLTDLGVRGSVAVALLVPMAQDPSPVLLAAFLLWVVNLAVPAVLGGLILWSNWIQARA